jgi:hypothetical protein
LENHMRERLSAMTKKNIKKELQGSNPERESDRGRGRPARSGNFTKIFYDIPLLHKEQMVEIAEKENITQTEAFERIVKAAYHEYFGNDQEGQ